jgi:hypothetical protein
MSKKAAISGRWSICCTNISALTAARRRTTCCAARQASTSPRMLGAFNEATPDWLSFFMFTYFTDRDGKMQLESLAQSGFDPLSRTCRFMLTEEAHHMFVGETGVGRTIQRTCEAMKEGRHRRPLRYRQGPRARRHRPADNPEESSTCTIRCRSTCSVGNLDQCGEFLQRRHQGPLPGGEDRRRPPSAPTPPIRC